MNVITITPPVVQFNTPYPSGAYLTSFFKQEGLNARWYDLNIDFFYSVFSAEGLRKLFELSEAAFNRLNGNGPTHLKFVEAIVEEEKPKKKRKKKNGD